MSRRSQLHVPENKFLPRQHGRRVTEHSQSSSSSTSRKVEADLVLTIPCWQNPHQRAVYYGRGHTRQGADQEPLRRPRTRDLLRGPLPHKRNPKVANVPLWHESNPFWCPITSRTQGSSIAGSGWLRGSTALPGPNRRSRVEKADFGLYWRQCASFGVLILVAVKLSFEIDPAVLLALIPLVVAWLGVRRRALRRRSSEFQQLAPPGRPRELPPPSA
jgi:hypothetical protein